MILIKPLTSLRFLFAVLVFGSHLWFLEDGGPVLKELHGQVFKEAFIGLSFFFVLSGFIMSYSYKQKLEADKTSFTNFWVARFARIYPMHFITLLLAIPLSFNTDLVSWVNKLLLNLALLQSFVPSDGFYFTFNAVSWSLSDEMFFYLCFPLLVLLFTNKRFRLWIPLAYLVAIPIGLLLIKDVFHQALFYINPLTRIGDFMAGMLLYRLYEKRKDNEYLNNRRLANIAEISTLGLLAASMYFHNYVPIGFRYSLYYLLPMCLLVYVFSYSRGIISDILSNKVLVYLGDLSFGFYLVHVLVIRYYTLLQSKVPALPLDATAVVPLFVVTLVLTAALHKYYEMPMNSYIRRIYSSRKIFDLTASVRRQLKKAG